MDNNKSSNNGIYFLTGIICLAVGLFMLTQQTVVTMSWYHWAFGSFRLASGLILVPFIVGIIVMFFNPKSLIGKIVTIIGIVIIIATIIIEIIESRVLFKILLFFSIFSKHSFLSGNKI